MKWKSFVGSAKARSRYLSSCVLLAHSHFPVASAWPEEQVKQAKERTLTRLSTLNVEGGSRTIDLAEAATRGLTPPIQPGDICQYP